MSKGRKRTVIPHNMPEAVRMYQAGANSIQVAVFLDVCPGTALRLLREAGVKIRRTGFAAGSVAPQASADEDDDAPLKRPPITPEYLNTLRHRWSEKMPKIIADAFQECGERYVHVR